VGSEQWEEAEKEQGDAIPDPRSTIPYQIWIADFWFLIRGLLGK
jgi:hypothetical protein